jgi:hypothetical protein
MLASFGSGITATMGDALLAVSSPDGLSAWQSVVGEFRQTVGNPLAGWPVLLGIAGFAALVWVNLRVARALVGSFDAHHAGPDPVDHHA